MKNIPIIENLHQKVLDAVSNKGELKMDSWHTNEEIKDGAHCGTTHCRAGWIVALGGKAGRDLELQTSTIFAAMQIAHKSSPKIPINIPRYYEPDEVAMEDIKRCAEEESKLSEK